MLQGARAATIAESNGRANMFLAAVSGGLVALGLVATASSLGAAFYGFGLVLLPTLAFVGLVTFERALQSSIEDTEYARRIALLRGYYFEHAPEIAPYLLRVPPAERLLMQRVPGDRWQGYRTVAGMVAVITAVLAGSTAALAAILIFDHSLAAAVISGALVALPTLIAMIRTRIRPGNAPPPSRSGPARTDPGERRVGRAVGRIKRANGRRLRGGNRAGTGRCATPRGRTGSRSARRAGHTAAAATGRP